MLNYCLDCGDNFVVILWNHCIFFRFMHKHIYNRHIITVKKTKTKIYKTVITCKATVTPEIKLKEEQLQN